MADNNENPTAERVENGEYYADARHWYSTLFHMPIAERSYYIIVIILSLINAYFSVASFIGIFPITVHVPFVTYSKDVWEDLPRIKSITASKDENENIAVMKFLLKSYVENRESFDVKLYELRYRNIGMQSTPEVFEQYKATMDASNRYSPYRIYTNRAVRAVDVDSIGYQMGDEGSQAHIIYDVSVISLVDGQEISHSKWQADVTFKYTNFTVDQSLDKHVWAARFFGLTGDALQTSGEKRKVLPMTFIVSDYQVKELLE